jgi:hypothetical protein
VIDANVYISALVFGGVPPKVVQLALEKPWRICISQSIMDEVGETLEEKFGWTKAELDFGLPPLWRKCIVVEPDIAVRASADPDDDRVLECAPASGAKLIVTGDGHLLRLKRFEGVVIITPRAFLDLVQAGRS